MAGGSASRTPEMLDPAWIHRKFEALADWQREVSATLSQAPLWPVGASSTATDFALTSGAWATVASVTFARPTWAQAVDVDASGLVYVVANTAFAVPTMRLAIDGMATMEIELPPGTGASAVPFYGTISTGRAGDVLGDVTVALQVYVLSAAAWHTGAANRKAEVTATCTWVRSPR